MLFSPSHFAVCMGWPFIRFHKFGGKSCPFASTDYFKSARRGLSSGLEELAASSKLRRGGCFLR